MSSFSKLKDDFQISSLLCKNETVLSSSIDFNNIISNAFDQITRRNAKRAEYFYLIANYIEQHDCTRLSSIIERLPSFLESAVNDEVESVALAKLIQDILIHGSSDVIGLVTKTLSKLISTSCKLVSKHYNSNLGLNVLQVLAKSKLRSLLAPSSKSVIKTCGEVIDRVNADHSLIASVFSLYLSLDSVDNWTHHWNGVSEEASRVLSLLGIRTHKQKAVSGGQSGSNLGSFAVNLDLKKHKGAQRAVYLLSVFRGLCAFLREMLVRGCATGFVSLDLTVFVPTLTALLNTTMDISLQDPLNFLEGDLGLSAADVCLVVSQLKVAYLSVLLALFETGHPTLVLYSTALYRPVAALTNKAEVRKVPQLLRAVLQCVGAAAKCFPNVVADSINGGSVTVLQMLQSEVGALTAVRSLVTGEEDDKKGKKGSNSSNDQQSSSQHKTSAYNQLAPDITLALFGTIELILLHCGATLSVGIRASIEEVVGQGLVCLVRGLLPPQFTDRKVHRAQSELLRQDTAVQNALLRLATVEVLLPARGGAGSSNVTVLRRVGESCLRQSETSSEAARTLLVIGALIHPIAVALPATSSMDVARAHLSNAQSGFSSSYGVPSTLTSDITDHASGAGSSEAVSEAVSEDRGLKRKVESVDETEFSFLSNVNAGSNVKKLKNENVAEPVVKKQTPAPLPERFQTKIAAPVASASEESDGSDDDSLPDIE